MKQFFNYINKDNTPALFNINKVIRAITIESNNNVIVLLDDFNERVRQVPDINPKTLKVVGTKNIRETVQSEIELNAEDGKRFFNLQL